ncbi:Adenine deaminase [Candidatus Hydrogenisulfobacillus filiaventi]|uniref:Adenine deaminase n=1 Tax=Candidatus Hydrogenisulfobacillus filiaventi TaxID=2707344 RepID=A0A6F8ZDU7_9FIRM|nr:amidohydrolase family protein [Bacillota bacterium]CAB1127937.1 Adenine deaminase [Candidatus Hydrogenisulfobacillus filiaventi]
MLPRYAVYPVLRAVALGERPAEVVVTGGTLLNVYTRELQPGAGVAIAAGRIAATGDVEYTIGPGTRVIDARGRFITPGLVDAHMHVESTLLTVTGFARAALVQGTTAVFMDPHEMANVFGLEGVRLLHAEGRGLPLKVFTTVPSCVPAAPGLEDAGAAIGIGDVQAALDWEGVAGLSEVMDVPGVLGANPLMEAEVAAALARGRPATGHLPEPDARTLQAYAAAGIDSDHESTRVEEALAKARAGMTVMIREGSAWQDVAALVPLITRHRIDPAMCVLVTDDVDAATLVHRGHLNHVLRRAVEEGLDPLLAWQMATIQPARYFRVQQDIGALGPGMAADLLLVDDLADPRPALVMTDGRVVAEDGRLTVDLPGPAFPEAVRRSVHLAAIPRAEELLPRVDAVRDGPALVRVIGAVENSALTRALVERVAVREHIPEAGPGNGLAYLAVLERHRASGRIGRGLVAGFGLRRGAVASTVAHDSHNLIVMGVDPADMVQAVEALAACQGGLVAVAGGRVLAQVELPVAGLMSTREAGEVAAAVEALEAAWRELGSDWHAPFMTLSLLALPVIPALRLTDRGLVEVARAAMVPLTVEA